MDTSGQTLIKSLEYGPFMIKPNQSELEAVVGKRMESEKDILDAAFKIHEKGPLVWCNTGC